VLKVILIQRNEVIKKFKEAGHDPHKDKITLDLWLAHHWLSKKYIVSAVFITISVCACLLGTVWMAFNTFLESSVSITVFQSAANLIIAAVGTILLQYKGIINVDPKGSAADTFIQLADVDVYEMGNDKSPNTSSAAGPDTSLLSKESYSSNLKTPL